MQNTWIAGAALGLAVCAPVAGWAEESFPLTCQGGGGMVATIADDGVVRMTFIAAAEGAAVPEPGHCAWADRGFREDEPAMLSYSGNLDGVHYLVDGMVGGKTFKVRAYNDNQGALVVTGIGE